MRKVVTEAERNRLILSLRPNVIAAVNRIFVAIRSGVEREDMMNEAWIGAIQAVDRFDPTRELKLATLAEHNIRGRILDYLRRMDSVSRDERRKIRKGTAQAPFVASLAALKKHVYLVDERASGAIARIEARSDARSFLSRAGLTCRQRLILKRKYWDEVLNREVARECGVHETAISQGHTRALAKLRVGVSSPRLR